MKLLSLRNQKGQALLLVLLTMAAILTVVLSVTSRSISEIAVTSFEEDALRAFSAAEAGVEQALLNPVIGPIPLQAPDPGDSSVFYSGAITTPVEADRNFLYPDPISAGETATFWLVSHDASGQLTCSGGAPCFSGAGVIRICWGNRGAPLNAAIEVLLFYDDVLPPQSVVIPNNNYQNVKVSRYTFDRNALTNGNGFASTVGVNNCRIDNKPLLYRSSAITPPSLPCQNQRGCRLMIKVRMFYNTVEQPVGIDISGGAGSFPSQGLLISSEGTAGESTRRVSVFQSFVEPPTLFDAAVFSLRDLVHN